MSENCSSASSVIREFVADERKLLVRQLQHARQAVQVAEVLLGNLHAGLVAGVVVHIGPGVLQDRAHLNLEPIRKAVHRTNVVQRHVAKAVYLVRLAFVHGIFPVHLEQAVYGRCHFVYIVTVKSDDAYAYNVCNVREGGVLGALELQLADERLLRFYTVLDGGHDEPCLRKDFLEGGMNLLCRLLEFRKVLPVFCQDGFAMGV